jgi:16S rRNA (uracil1498-N3)-methyltransferase
MEIIPLITRRTIKQKVNIERLTTIAKEAAEQSGRGIVPAIKAPVPFANVEKSELEKKTTIFFHTNESARTLDEITSSQGELNIFIGPEGGWDETEVKFAMAHNFYLASLGKLILRAETAAIIASYLAVHLS